MAPSEVLRTILADFDYVDRNVIAHMDRRVRLVRPKNCILCLGRRWRRVDKGSAEEERLSQYLCCYEQLRFVGTLHPAKAVRDDEKCPLLRFGVYPEIYVGRENHIFVYIKTSRSDAIFTAARDVDELVREGVRSNGMLNVNVCGLFDEESSVARLANCRDFCEVMFWRDQTLGRKIVLGDGSAMCPCDMYFAGCGLESLSRWASEAEVKEIEVFGLVCQPIVTPPVILLLDRENRVYGAAGVSGSLVLIADTVVEFVNCGITRFERNGLFFGSIIEKQLSREPECPNQRDHRLDIRRQRLTQIRFERTVGLKASFQRVMKMFR
nr:MAG: tegument protein UL23 [Herpesviridae sp.]